MTSRMQVLSNTNKEQKQLYILSLETIGNMINSGIKNLHLSIIKLNALLNETQQAYTTFTLEEITHHSLGRITMTNMHIIYYAKGQLLHTAKESIKNINDVIAHLNIMIMKVNSKIKKTPKFEFRFGTEEELILSFIKIFSNTMFNSELFKKICHEIWKSCILSKDKGLNEEMIIQSFEERLDLFCQGISVVSKNPLNYPLHKAIIENNLALIQQICSGTR